MARYAHLNLDQSTVDRFKAARLDISNDAGRVVNNSEQLEYLLDHWMQHREAPTDDPTQDTPTPATGRPHQ